MVPMQWQLDLESFEPAVLKSRFSDPLLHVRVRGPLEKNYLDVQTTSEAGFVEDLRSLLLKGGKMFGVA